MAIRIVDSLVWISATDRAAVLSGFAQASSAAAGVAPIAKAESGAARFVSWLRETSQSWLVVFDDLAESAVPEGLWPQALLGPDRHQHACRSIAYAAQRGAQVVPVGFFSRRESVNYLTERLSANPAQRHGVMELADELRCEPLALAQGASVVANSTLACRGLP